MAEAALKKLEEQLNCAICLDTYTDPKQLQCHHVFCQKCLVRLEARDKQGLLTLTCPTCRHVTPVPAKGVEGLQSAFQTSKLLEIVEEHKKVTASAIAEKTERGPKSLEPQEDPKITVCCREHGGKVEVYCVTCEEPVCLKCVITGGRHQGHNTELPDQAFERYKLEITSSLEPMEKQLATINEVLTQLDTYSEEISDQQTAIEADIHDTFRRLHDMLEVRKTQLIGQLHQITQAKLKNLAVQRDQIETTLAQLSSCLEFVKESLKTSSEMEVLMMKTNIVKQVTDLTTAFTLDTLKPSTEADMVFLTGEDFNKVCQNYGRVSIPGLPDPLQCIATGSGLKLAAVVGRTVSITLHAKDFKGQPCDKQIEALECELVSETTDTRVTATVQAMGKNEYKISYQPTIKGRHQLHVRVEGQHIGGSPFSVLVPMMQPRVAITEVVSPRGVAIMQSGKVVVTERGCVSVFSPSGRKRSFGQGSFHDPFGVTVDDEDNILVADRGRENIQKFTPRGKLLAAVASEKPKDIKFNPSNSKLYVTEANSKVRVLNSDDLTSSGQFRLGSGGHSVGLAFDTAGNVYVTGYSERSHYIEVFTAEGEYLRTLNSQGTHQPYCIAIDTSGLVLVSEIVNNRVSVFTSQGQFLTTLGGTAGEGPGEFSSPCGLAVAGNGTMYVCDMSNNRIQVF